jgi:hypothetical protein
MLRGDKFSSMRGDVPPLIGHTTVSSATKSSLCWQTLAKTAGPNYPALRLQRRSYKRCEREAWQSIRLASLGTERLWYFRSAMARKGGNAIGVAPKESLEARGPRLRATDN